MKLQLIITIILLSFVLSNAGRRFKSGNFRNSSISGQIIGGASVPAVGIYPWMASIIRAPTTTPIQYCGGSLIHDSWVLTSAFCAVGASSFKIFFGTLIHNAGLVRTSNTYFIHPSYTAPPAFNIALIKLSTPVGLPVANIDAVPLVPRRLCCDPELYRNVLTGWGMTSMGGAMTPAAKLQYIYFSDITNFVCMTAWGLLSITPSIMCTTSNATNMPYTFDQGDPLVRMPVGNYKYLQAGIVSQFKAGLPTMYTRVCHYHDWIQKITLINFG